MTLFPGIKVVTAKEMARIEQLAYDAGARPETFMENAGIGIAEATFHFCEEFEFGKHALLLIGKGNNGGDAYVAGCHLKKMGFIVTAVHIYPVKECSALCQAQCKRFQEEGGTVTFATSIEDVVLPEEGVVLDGLTGTGFKGKAEGLLAEVIERVNHFHLPIIAIDIPSGLNGSTGDVGSVAIHATLTLYLGLPKLGFFLKEGYNHIGEILPVDFGLEERFIDEAKADALLPFEESFSFLLPPIRRTRHKYQAGYVLALGASPSMPGAALLACHAALRAGAGIVRLFFPEGMEAELSAAPYELIRTSWDLKDDKAIREEAKRASALLIGPGMGRNKESKKAFFHLLDKLNLPTVIDADALYFLSEEKVSAFPEKTILTPHHEEMRRLLSKGEDLWIGAQKFADQNDVTIVLKGAPTVIFHPFQSPTVMPYGDPGMATAGTGDVLTGILAALLAQGLTPPAAALLGTFLHALAGEAAAFENTSYSLIASDLIAFLPEAFNQLLETP